MPSRKRSFTTKRWNSIFDQLRDRILPDGPPLQSHESGASPFHPYGEVTPTFITQLIEQVPITPTDIFYDMGSGIGNVVLQVAAQVGCRSRGTEIREEFVNLAQDLQHHLSISLRQRKLADHTPRVQFFHGDMLEMEEPLREATIVFVNNGFVDDPFEQTLFTFLAATVSPGTKIVCLRDAFERFRPTSPLCKEWPCHRFEFPWRKFGSCEEPTTWGPARWDCVVYVAAEHPGSFAETSSLLETITVSDPRGEKSSTSRRLTVAESRIFLSRLKRDQFVSTWVPSDEDLKNLGTTQSMKGVFRRQRFLSLLQWPGAAPLVPADPVVPQFARCTQPPRERARTAPWLTSLAPHRPRLFLKRNLSAFHERRTLPQIQHGRAAFQLKRGRGRPRKRSESPSSDFPCPHLPGLRRALKSTMPLYHLNDTRSYHLTPQRRASLALLQPGTYNNSFLMKPSDFFELIGSIPWEKQKQTIATSLPGRTRIFLRRTLSPIYRRKQSPSICHVILRPFADDVESHSVENGAGNSSPPSFDGSRRYPCRENRSLRSTSLPEFEWNHRNTNQSKS